MTDTIGWDDEEKRDGAPTADNWPLGGWWMDNAALARDRTVPKLSEYGSYDLNIVGQVLCRAMGWHDAPERVHAEIGCWFHELSKVARAFEAIAHHRLPSDDTAFDIKIYATMIERIREVGEWR